MPSLENWLQGPYRNTTLMWRRTLAQSSGPFQNIPFSPLSIQHRIRRIRIASYSTHFFRPNARFTAPLLPFVPIRLPPSQFRISPHTQSFNPASFPYQRALPSCDRFITATAHRPRLPNLHPALPCPTIPHLPQRLSRLQTPANMFSKAGRALCAPPRCGAAPETAAARPVV
jgi:hypothetical protein